MGKWQGSDASSAGILGTKELPQKYITLEEVVDEAMLLLSRSAPNIIEEILVFTDLDVRDLKGNMAYLRKTYPSSRNTS
jgi:hypothetical protein